MPSLHEPVLYREAIAALNLKPGAKVIDGTVGGGGHLEAILKAVGPHGKILGLDADPQAIIRAEQKFLNDHRLILINNWFSEIKNYVLRYNLEPVAAVILDLGWSADQLADLNRGFSFKTGGQLDLRFNPATTGTAADILNTASVDELTDIFKNLGDEPRAKLIARRVVDRRQQQPFMTVDDLLTAVADVYKVRLGKIHPATKVWQALRIAVNNELDELAKVLPTAIDVLAPGGRLAVISFHSGEDKIVKSFLKRASTNCLCPPGIPVCRCGHKASVRLIATKAIKATDQEIKTNPRSRSARLRVAEKI